MKKYAICPILALIFSLIGGNCCAGEATKNVTKLATVSPIDSWVGHAGYASAEAPKPWRAAVDTMISVFTPTPGLSVSIPVQFNGAALLHTIQF